LLLDDQVAVWDNDPEPEDEAAETPQPHTVEAMCRANWPA
jgi:hypothetical protein